MTMSWKKLWERDWKSIGRCANPASHLYGDCASWGSSGCCLLGRGDGQASPLGHVLAVLSASPASPPASLPHSPLCRSALSVRLLVPTTPSLGLALGFCSRCHWCPAQVLRPTLEFTCSSGSQSPWNGNSPPPVSISLCFSKSCFVSCCCCCTRKLAGGAWVASLVK